MANLEIYAPGDDRLIKPFTYSDVFLRSAWTHAWQWIPFLEVDEVIERSAPGVSQTRLSFDFGRIKQAPAGFWASYEAVFANGAFCMIRGHNQYSDEPLWAGIIETDEVELRHAYLEGVASGGLFSGDLDYVGIPQGRQRLTAYGIEHLLDRWPITGSVTEAGVLDRPIQFNRRVSWGERLAGNRSEFPDEHGIHYFASDGYLWTALDVVRYLLWHHGPTSPAVILDGQWHPLQYLVEEWNFDGMTVWQALAELIDRRRGLGWRILPRVVNRSIDGAVWLWVYSQLPIDLVTPVEDAPDITLPGNMYQSTIDFSFAKDVEANVQLSGLEQYDLIDVTGGPLSVCCTLSFADLTLEPGWTQQQEDMYKAGSTAADPSAEDHDKARKSEQWRAVYQKFRVPDNWDWTAGDGSGYAPKYIAAPIVDQDGNILVEDQAPAWTYAKMFRREIPFLADEEGTQELRQPFVLLHKDNGDWEYAEKSEDIMANVRLSDNELAMYVEPRPLNHCAAKNHWDGAEPTEHDPVYDYEVCRATVMLPTDQHLRVLRGVHPAYAKKVKHIHMPNTEAWYVLHGTVVDVIDGTPMRWGEEIEVSPGYVVRNDINRLRSAAVLAAVWYSIERRTITYRYKDISLAHFPGAMIRAVTDGLATAQVNTVVTERRWDFLEQTTTVRTGFEDLDAEGLING